MQGHRIGYVRVSSFDQNPERQLEQTQVSKVFTDKASGKDTQRPQLEALLSFVREGDTVVVHSMDRLARNLDDLRRQKVLAEQYVGVLEKQLPSRAEMDALLSDINQAGVGRGAQLQLFRPGSVELKKHYAELPIAVKVVGGFHDLASFSSDLANLPRIVTLNNITIEHRNGGNLEMSATAKTFRYLDKDELARQSAGGQK